VIGLDTGAGHGIRDTDGRNPILHRNAIGSWIRAEVLIECTVFLHNDDDVSYLMDVTGFLLRD
jgi:hypothetical protein